MSDFHFELVLSEIVFEVLSRIDLESLNCLIEFSLSRKDLRRMDAWITCFYVRSVSSFLPPSVLLPHLSFNIFNIWQVQQGPKNNNLK